MICDAHIHYIPLEIADQTSFYKGPWADKHALYDFLEVNNIEQALLVYPSTDAHLKLGSYGQVCRIYNKAVSGLMKENLKIIAAGLIDLEDISSLDSQVQRLADEGFRLVSLASSYGGRFLIDKVKSLLGVLDRFGFAVFVHPQTLNPIGFGRVKDPLLMPVLEYSFDVSMFLGLLMTEGLLSGRRVRFIFSSLAGVMPFLKERFDRVYTMLRQRGMVKDLGSLPSQILRGVYVDTSGASIGNLRLALELFGEDKLLWGSDYPVCGDISRNISVLDTLGEDLKEKIIYSNFARLFNHG